MRRWSGTRVPLAVTTVRSPRPNHVTNCHETIEVTVRCARADATRKRPKWVGAAAPKGQAPAVRCPERYGRPRMPVRPAIAGGRPDFAGGPGRLIDRKSTVDSRVQVMTPSRQ